MGRKTSLKCVAAFFLGVLALAAGVFVLARRSDMFLVAVVLFTLATVLVGSFGWREVGRSAGRLDGKRLAGVGMALPMGGFCLVFLMLPHV